jgi:hypothetical protein
VRQTRAVRLVSSWCLLPDGQAHAAHVELEERNRARIAAVKAARPDRAPITSRWFEPFTPDAPAGKGLRWRYRRGSYWEARAGADWAGLPDIFGLQAR